MRTGQMTPEVVSSWPQLFLLPRTAAMVADINRIVLIVLAMDSFLMSSEVVGRAESLFSFGAGFVGAFVRFFMSGAMLLVLRFRLARDTAVATSEFYRGSLMMLHLRWLIYRADGQVANYLRRRL